MINFFNILLGLINIGFLIALVVYAKKINNKNFKVDILDTKVKAIQKRMTKEQGELTELKQRLEEQKIVLNQKWDQLQSEGKMLDEKALKIDEERRLFKVEQDKVTSQKIAIEQEQMKIDRMILNLKEKWEHDRKEILKERERLKYELQRIQEAKHYYESTESKVKIDFQKAEKEKSYLASQFKDLEAAKRELEKNHKTIVEHEQQIKDAAKKHIEEKMVFDREQDRINQEKNRLEEQKSELDNIREKLEREKLKLQRLRHESELTVASQQPDATRTGTAAKGLRFRLEGNILRDETDGKGQLFGKELPKIIDQQSWKEVDGIVIGEEGDEAGRLRWKIKPESSSPIIDLNRLEQKGKIGIISQSTKSWFFIGFYNNNGELIDCLDFRFVPGLNAIIVDEPPCLPGANGHQLVKLKFLHEKACKVRLAHSDIKTITITSEGESTKAIIPPDPAWDITDWQIEDHSGRRTDIKLVLNRIWWSLASESERLHRNDATDKIMEIPFETLQSTAQAGLAIWLPKRHEFQQITVGWDKLNRKIFWVARNYDHVFLPLGEFLDDDVLQDLKEKRLINLWLDEEINVCIPMAVILPPWLTCRAKDCQFRSPDKHEMIDHIKNNHIHHFFHELNYEEIRLKYNLELPVQIYRCGYCSAYVLADNSFKNPASAIIDHIEQCPQAEMKDDAVHINFRIVKDSSEIRQQVIKDLPQAWKCNCCGQYFEDQNWEELGYHLIADHESELYS